MNIYNRSSLVAFYKKHPDCKETLEKWYHDVLSKSWRKPGDITGDFKTARTIKNSRAIFKINENDYRLIVEVNFQKGWVFIKFIGTHAEYDKVDAEKVNQFKPKKVKRSDMPLKILKTKKEYQQSLERFEEIFQAKSGTPESNEADILALLIKDYEDKHYVINVPNPIDAIKYRMEQQGLSNKDLAQILGFKSRVSDIFKNSRKLNLNMIRKLYNELHIPLETLVKEY